MEELAEWGGRGVGWNGPLCRDWAARGHEILWHYITPLGTRNPAAPSHLGLRCTPKWRS